MADDFLAYISDDETKTCFADIPTIGTSHKALAVTRASGQRYPDCGMCYMEEFITRKLVSNTNRNVRQWDRRKTHLFFCQDEHCKIIAHSCTLPETKLQKNPRFNGMSCFEISHLS